MKARNIHNIALNIVEKPGIKAFDVEYLMHGELITAKEFPTLKRAKKHQLKVIDFYNRNPNTMV